MTPSEAKQLLMAAANTNNCLYRFTGPFKCVSTRWDSLLPNVVFDSRIHLYLQINWIEKPDCWQCLGAFYQVVYTDTRYKLSNLCDDQMVATANFEREEKPVLSGNVSFARLRSCDKFRLRCAAYCLDINRREIEEHNLLTYHQILEAQVGFKERLAAIKASSLDASDNVCLEKHRPKLVG